MMTRRLIGSLKWGSTLGGGAVAASMLLMNKNPDVDPHQFGNSRNQQKWRLEFPEKAKDDVLLARKIVSPVDTSGLDLRVYQYQTCPYCCKVRAFLDYYGFSYEVVEVNPVTRAQIKFSHNYSKVPIVVARAAEKQLNDSAFVISLLATFMTDPKRSLQDILKYYPHHRNVDEKTGKETLDCPNKYFIMFEEQLESEAVIQEKREEREWRAWVDEKFIHVISPNVYRTMQESVETFKWFSEAGDWRRNFPVWERVLAIYVGAAAMFVVAKRLKKKHLITDVRQSMLNCCREWMAAVGPDRPFMGGQLPNLADLALYGSMNAFVGCRAFAEMRERTDIGKWYDRVDEAVQAHAGSGLLQQSLQIRNFQDGTNNN